MDRVAVRGLRIGSVVLLALAVTCAAGAAQTDDRSSGQLRQATTRGQASSTGPVASSGQQAGLGSMRYYGGPKSPMWRAPAPE
jgi:hypothetical protein